MAKKQQSPKKSREKRPVTAATRSTFNEDRRRAKAGQAPKPNRTKAELGAKVYTCLHEGCESTFETWGVTVRHMRRCGGGEELASGKPCLHASRAKGNALLQAGKIQLKSYPEPTEVELAEAVGDFYIQNRDPKKFRHVLNKVVQETWGPGDFVRFGFGSFVEFCQKHDFPHTGTTSSSPAKE